MLYEVITTRTAQHGAPHAHQLLVAVHRRREVRGHPQLPGHRRAEDAEDVIVMMGSGCETVAATIDYLVAQGEKVGMVIV